MPLMILWLWVSPFFCSILDIGPALKTISGPIQNWCTAQVPLGIHSELTRAMVCGVDPSLSEALIFQQSGLYHLLVVSGGHLAFFVELLRPFARKKIGSILVLIFLITYSLMCGAQPPVIRALIQWVIYQQRNRIGIYAHSGLITFYSGIICLSLSPAWIHSLSFWLSWMATLACQSAMSLRLKPACAAAFIHIVLLPGLMSLGSAHPLSILNNWLLGPLLGSALLPLSILACVVPALNFVTDFAWSLLILILRPLNEFSVTSFSNVPRGFLIAYISFFQLIAWQGWIWWQRRF